jgi:hypothetical protein
MDCDAPERLPRVELVEGIAWRFSRNNPVAGRGDPKNSLDVEELAENRLRCFYLLPPPA